MNQYIYTANTTGVKRKQRYIFFNGRISKIILKDKANGLEPAKRKDFEEFVNANAHEIVEKWVEYFVKKKHIIPKVITQKVKNVQFIG